MGIGRVICVMAAIGIGAPVAAQSIPLDRGFKAEGISWNTSGSTTLIFSAREIQGKTVVCGVYFNEGATPDIAVKKMLRGSRIRAGRTTLVSNVLFFPRVNPDGDLSKTKAKCKTSRKPWKDSYAKQATLKIPSGPVEF